MIPNNQFWFAQEGSSYPVADPNYEYVVSRISYNDFATITDGNKLFTTESGDIRLIGGWNGGWSPTTRPEQWESTDGGINFTQIADAPWQGRHDFACGWMLGKFWVMGGDANQVLTGQRDVWTYTDAAGWVQVTNDWGNVAGDRAGHSYAVLNNYFYLIGGSIQDVVRSNDGINWTKMGDLPAALQPYAYACACTHKGYIYIMGGSATGSNGNQYKVFRTRTGATYEQMTDVPNNSAAVNPTMATGTQWSLCWSKWGVLFMMAGTGTTGNSFGLVYSIDDGATWLTNFSFNIQANHARAILHRDDDSMLFVQGTLSQLTEVMTKSLKTTLAYKVLYSLKKANASYTGSCIRIRRSSDNAEQDIGFDGSGDLDTAAITTFVGANSAYVKTWYDQSGLGYDLTNTTAGTQPRIVNAGTLETQDGYAAINFTGTTIKLEYSVGNINVGNQYIISAVASYTTNTQIVGAATLGNNYCFYFQVGGVISHNIGDPNENFAAASVTYGTNIVPGTRHVLSFYRNRKSGWYYKDGVERTSGYPTSTLQPEGLTIQPSRFESNNVFRRIGTEAGGLSFVGKMQEFQIKSGYLDVDANVAQAAEIATRW